MKPIRHAMALCIALVSLSATISTGFAAEEPTQLSLAEMEKAFIDAVLADGDAVKEANYPSYKKPFNAEIYQGKLGCMRSNASGNFDIGWTLADDFGQHLSVDERGYYYLDRFLVMHGFRAHSADEKAMWILDLQTRRIIPVLLHAFPWVHRYVAAPRTVGSNWHVSAFLTPDMPVQLASDIEPVIEDWLHKRINLEAVCEYAEKPCPLPTKFYALQCD